MTRKDYKVIAEGFAVALFQCEMRDLDGDVHHGAHEVVRTMGLVVREMAHAYPNFDEDKFRGYVRTRSYELFKAAVLD